MELMRLLFAGDSKQNEAARMCGKFYWFNYDPVVDVSSSGWIVLVTSNYCREGSTERLGGINRRTANPQWLRTGVGNPSVVEGFRVPGPFHGPPELEEKMAYERLRPTAFHYSTCN